MLDGLRGACEGMDPVIFDWPTSPDLALATCTGCPVRDLCLQQVDPAGSSYDGIAGGYVWTNGYARPTRNRHAPAVDPALDHYLNSSWTH